MHQKKEVVAYLGEPLEEPPVQRQSRPLSSRRHTLRHERERSRHRAALNV